MTFMLRNYKVIIFTVLGLILLAAVTWLLTSKTKADKLPSRGVFVMQTESGELEEYAENNDKARIYQVC